MKAITILATILITCMSCNCHKKAIEQAAVAQKESSEKELVNPNAQNEIMIEYQANSRGFHQKIIVQNQNIAVSNDRDDKVMPTATKLSNSDWKEVLTLFNEVKLENLQNLKAPTEKRMYDGAAIASFKIIINDKTYETPSFDHGFPPIEIKKLVDKLVSLTE